MKDPKAAPPTPADHEQNMPAYLDAIRGKLADLAVMQHQAAGAHRAIIQAAHQRLEAVQRELTDLAPRARLDDAAGERYRALILERGRLHRLVSAS